MKHGSLYALALATVASVGGTRLSAIAIPWLVLTTTNSPVLTGLVGLAELLPYVIAKALSGPFIDRYGARRVAILSDWLSTAAIAIVPMLYWLGLLSIWVLLPAVALLGMLRAPADAAKHALVPAVAEALDVSLERTTGVLGTSNRLAGTLGAAAGGLLVASLGSGPALLVNALAFGISAVTLSVWLKLPDTTSDAADTAPASYLSRMAEGWRAFSADPVLVTLVIMLAVTGLFDNAYSLVLLPVWVRSAGLDASWVGILLAVFSGAAIGGAAIGSFLVERLARLPVYVIGFLFAGPVPLSLLALHPPMVIVVIVLLASGFAAGFLNPVIGAMLFERIPRKVVGRVVALVSSLTWALIPFGGLYAGVLVETIGTAPTLWITAVFYLAAVLGPLAVVQFRAVGRKAPVSA